MTPFYADGRVPRQHTLAHYQNMAEAARYRVALERILGVTRDPSQVYLIAHRALNEEV